jgi:hypothetical protein
MLCALLVVLMLPGCSLGMGGRPQVSEAELNDRMSKMIDREIDTVLPYIEEDLEGVSRSLGSGTFRGVDVVRGMYEEEHGREYLEFCYNVELARNPEEVVEAAASLIGEEDMAELRKRVNELESKAADIALVASRTLTAAQKKEFFADMRKLVIKSTVLLTAGIVYACIPKAVLWGKVTAACAVSVAAGVVASAVLSVVEYYQFENTTLGTTFESWIDSITKEPYTAWALAAGMIATGKTMERSPILTGLIIAVFAIYGVVDDVKPMLKKYNFSF